MTGGAVQRELRIEARFRGPDASGNGGYVAGLVAGALEGSAEVTLRAPPPLDTPLRLASAGPDRAELTLIGDGELVAEAVAADLQLDVPEAPEPEQVALAAERSPMLGDRPFPHCFVCGNERAAGDGLRIFAGPVPDRPGVVAAPWTPADSLPTHGGALVEEIVWAALDCPGAAAVWEDELRPILLGRIAVRPARLIRPGEPLCAVAWRIGSEGRKHFTGSALFDAEGDVCARARATWIEPRSRGDGDER